MLTSGILWVATIVLTVVAFAFVGLPLLKNNRKAALLAIALALPLFAAGLYMTVGRPTAATVVPPTQSSAQAQAPGAQTPNKVGSVASMVDGLVARLEQNPDDADNWLLLARTYKYLNRYDEATVAYERAAALGQYDADLAAMAAADQPPAESPTQIFGTVSLSAEAAEFVTPDDTVFIFARATNGPPMPLAVLRRPAADLPIDFLLNDSQSMSPDMKLSDFEEVIVTARITRTGVVTDALKGLEAKSGPVVLADNQHVNLQIK